MEFGEKDKFVHIESAASIEIGARSPNGQAGHHRLPAASSDLAAMEKQTAMEQFDELAALEAYAAAHGGKLPPPKPEQKEPAPEEQEQKEPAPEPDIDLRSPRSRKSFQALTAMVTPGFKIKRVPEAIPADTYMEYVDKHPVAAECYGENVNVFVTKPMFDYDGLAAHKLDAIKERLIDGRWDEDKQRAAKERQYKNKAAIKAEYYTKDGPRRKAIMSSLIYEMDAEAKATQQKGIDEILIHFPLAKQDQIAISSRMDQILCPEAALKLPAAKMREACVDGFSTQEQQEDGLFVKGMHFKVSLHFALNGFAADVIEFGTYLAGLPNDRRSMFDLKIYQCPKGRCWAGVFAQKSEDDPRICLPLNYTKPEESHLHLITALTGQETRWMPAKQVTAQAMAEAAGTSEDLEAGLNELFGQKPTHTTLNNVFICLFYPSGGLKYDSGSDCWYKTNQYGMWKEINAANVKIAMRNDLYPKLEVEFHRRKQNAAAGSDGKTASANWDAMRKMCLNAGIGGRDGLLADLKDVYTESNVGELDTNYGLIGTDNGVIDINAYCANDENYHRPALPEELVSMSVGYDWSMEVDEAARKQVLEFTQEMFVPSDEIDVTKPLSNPDYAYIMTKFAARLRGDSVEWLKEIDFLYGKNGNEGKSLLAKLCGRALGEYFKMTDPVLITGAAKKDSNAADPLMRSLDKKRMVMVSEPDDSQRCNINSVKRFTGDTEAGATRDLFKNVQKKSQYIGFGVFVLCNAVPAMRAPSSKNDADEGGIDSALGNRLCITSMQYQFFGVTKLARLEAEGKLKATHKPADGRLSFKLQEVPIRREFLRFLLSVYKEKIFPLEQAGVEQEIPKPARVLQSYVDFVNSATPQIKWLSECFVLDSFADNGRTVELKFEAGKKSDWGIRTSTLSKMFAASSYSSKEFKDADFFDIMTKNFLGYSSTPGRYHKSGNAWIQGITLKTYDVNAATLGMERAALTSSQFYNEGMSTQTIREDKVRAPDYTAGHKKL